MKTKRRQVIKIITGFIIVAMVLFSSLLITNTISLVREISNGQSSEKVNQMRNHSDEELLLKLKEKYQHQDSIINTAKGIITINRNVTYKEYTYTTPGYYAFILITMIIKYVLIIGVLFNTFKIYSDTLSGLVFVNKNIKRFNNISFLLIGYAIYEIIYGLTGNTILYYFFNSAQNKPEINIDISNTSQILILVLIVLSFSYFFRLGIHLKEENDLTV